MFTSAGWCLDQGLQDQGQTQSDYCRIRMNKCKVKHMETLAINNRPERQPSDPTCCECWGMHLWHQQEPSATLKREKWMRFQTAVIYSSLIHTEIFISAIAHGGWGPESFTFEWFDLCFSIWGRRKVPAQNKTGGRHCRIACKKKNKWSQMWMVSHSVLIKVYDYGAIPDLRTWGWASPSLRHCPAIHQKQLQTWHPHFPPQAASVWQKPSPKWWMDHQRS